MTPVRLTARFYQRTDVVQIARDLLGKVLITQLEGQVTSVIITETEAYRAPDDRACHAWGNRLTPRTRTMFESGGRAYIYLCYGIHHLFNVVTGPKDMAHAVLIRAGEPLEGVETMLRRRNMEKIATRLTAGPGALGKALALHTHLDHTDFTDPASPVWIEDRGITVSNIASGPRIGVDYAGECAAWPWRFWIEESKWVSKK